MARQAERRDSTRAALISAARASFMAHGYDATSLEAVLAGTSLSKGALYHHFASKADLLAAVFDTVTRETIARALTVSKRPAHPREAFQLALKSWLRAVLAPEPRRVILETGPAVLGLARARSIEAEIVIPSMRRAIEAMIEQGAGTCDDCDLVARLLNAAVGELAFTATERGTDDATLKQLDSQIDVLLSALVPTVAGATARS